MKHTNPNHKLYGKYIVPKYSELRDLGYVPESISKDCIETYLSILSAPDSPFRTIAIEFNQVYGFRDITKRLLMAYAYVLNNLPQFYNQLDIGIYSAITLSTRYLTVHHKKFISKDKKQYTQCSKEQFDKLIDRVINNLHNFAVVVSLQSSIK